MPQPVGPVYKRVLLKISGEGFCHEGGFGIEAEQIEDIARQCVDVAKSGVQLAIVVGGGGGGGGARRGGGGAGAGGRRAGGGGGGGGGRGAAGAGDGRGPGAAAD